jgi:hypothetical protein
MAICSLQSSKVPEQNQDDEDDCVIIEPHQEVQLPTAVATEAQVHAQAPLPVVFPPAVPPQQPAMQPISVPLQASFSLDATTGQSAAAVRVTKLVVTPDESANSAEKIPAQLQGFSQSKLSTIEQAQLACWALWFDRNKK